MSRFISSIFPMFYFTHNILMETPFISFVMLPYDRYSWDKTYETETEEKKILNNLCKSQKG